MSHLAVLSALAPSGGECARRVLVMISAPDRLHANGVRCPAHRQTNQLEQQSVLRFMSSPVHSCAIGRHPLQVLFEVCTGKYPLVLLAHLFIC